MDTRSNVLRRTVLAAMGITAAALAPQTASATTLVLDGPTLTGNGPPQGWNGANNGYEGWAHHSAWYSMFTADVGPVAITVTGSDGFRPAFTVWSSSEFVSSPNGHGYNQIGNNPAPSWLSGVSFVGFANNSTDPHFGPGPDNTSFPQGLPALSGTTAEIGTTGGGDQFARLLFNATAGTYYTVAVGGSGGASGYHNFQISAAAVPVPAAVWLFGSALAGMGAIGRRKREAAA